MPQIDEQYVKNLLKAAESGDAEAENELENIDKIITNYPQVFKAAEQGEATALYTIGQYRESGTFLPQDYELAASCYEEAAKKGHSEAQKALDELREKIKIMKDYTDEDDDIWSNNTGKEGFLSRYLKKYGGSIHDSEFFSMVQKTRDKFYEKMERALNDRDSDDEC